VPLYHSIPGKYLVLRAAMADDWVLAVIIAGGVLVALALFYPEFYRP
jgi:hypothetical protein